MKTLPLWIEEGWLSKNKDLIFVKRFRNTVSQIEGDRAVARATDKPMDATRACLSGEDAANATKFQWSETLKELQTLEGIDREEAEKSIARFRNEYKDYLPFLEG